MRKQRPSKIIDWWVTEPWQPPSHSPPPVVEARSLSSPKNCAEWDEPGHRRTQRCVFGFIERWLPGVSLVARYQSILMRLDRFECTDADALAMGFVKDWHTHLGSNTTFAVDFVGVQKPFATVSQPERQKMPLPIKCAMPGSRPDVNLRNQIARSCSSVPRGSHRQFGLMRGAIASQRTWQKCGHCPVAGNPRCKHATTGRLASSSPKGPTAFGSDVRFRNIAHRSRRNGG